MVDNRNVVAQDAPRDKAKAPLSDEDRKRFFRPPLTDVTPVVPPAPAQPAPAQPAPISNPSGDDPPKLKSFDEIISGEFHRMTDSIPIIGHNRQGEPRRGIVTLGLIVAVLAVIGGVVAVILKFTL